MGETPGEGDSGPDVGHGGGAPVDKVVGHVVDEFLAATRPSPEAAAQAEAARIAAAWASTDAAAARATSDQAVVDSMVSGITGQAPPAAPAGAVNGDGLRTLTAMTTTQTEIQPGSDFGARHQYNLAIAGVAVVALAAFVGALLFLGGQSASPGGVSAPGGAAVIATPTPTPIPTSTPTPEPTPEPTPTPQPTSEPTASPTLIAQSVTLRGLIDVRPITKTGLEVGDHPVELVVFQDNGEVTGTFTIVFEAFPIGAVLTATFDEADNLKWAAFKNCTVRLALEGNATGTFNAAKGALSGKATFRSTREDVRDCLKTRPPNVTIDAAVSKPTTVKWSATFDGKKAKGTVSLKPELAFTATPQD